MKQSSPAKFILVLGAICFVLVALNLSTTTTLAPKTIRIEISGNEGAEIYAEIISNDKTETVTQTLPVTLSYDAYAVEFKVALLDVDNPNHLSVEVFRDNDSVLSNSGKGVYGKVEFKESKSPFYLPYISDKPNKISTVSIGNMPVEDIESLLSSRSN